jgi:hypothetical protein
MEETKFDATAAEENGKAVLASCEALAKEAVERQYAEDPSLMARFGCRGYEKSLEDARYTIHVLAESVSLGDPSLLTRYAAWLSGVLETAGLPRATLLRHLRLLKETAAIVLAPGTRESPTSHLLIAIESLEGMP